MKGRRKIRWERSATVHAKLMDKDVSRLTETQLIFKWTGLMWNSPVKRHLICVGGNLLDPCWGTLVHYGKCSRTFLATNQVREVAIHRRERRRKALTSLWKTYFTRENKVRISLFPFYVIFEPNSSWMWCVSKHERWIYCTYKKGAPRERNLKHLKLLNSRNTAYSWTLRHMFNWASLQRQTRKGLHNTSGIFLVPPAFTDLNF